MVTALSITFSVSNLSAAFFFILFLTFFFFWRGLTVTIGFIYYRQFFSPLVNKVYRCCRLSKGSLNFHFILTTLVLTHFLPCPDFARLSGWLMGPEDKRRNLWAGRVINNVPLFIHGFSGLSTEHLRS